MSAPTFNRSDTLLGICEALGQDLGFNPLWLRVALAVGLFWNFGAVIAAYLGLGVVVLIARAVTPARKVEPASRQAVVAGNDDEVAEMAEAA